MLSTAVRAETTDAHGWGRVHDATDKDISDAPTEVKRGSPQLSNVTPMQRQLVRRSVVRLDDEPRDVDAVAPPQSCRPCQSHLHS